MIDRLLAEPHRFEFFQAVRQLERWFAREDGGRAGASGLSSRIRFRNSLSLAFPASEISEFRVLTQAAAANEAATGDPARPAAQDIQRIEITPAFMGLLGAGGALPAFYTELFAQREALQKDSAARGFMDIFVHRAVTLFYQAWRKHRMAVEFEADRRNRFLPLVLAVAGIGQASLRDRLHAREGGVADDTLAGCAGTLQQRPRSAAAIRQVLAQYFGVAVALEQFVGRWFCLPVAHQTALGASGAGLGRGAVAGERVWQRDLRMRLTLGPMTRERLGRFLPGGPAALALRELLTLLTGVTVEYEVRLALRADEVRPMQLAGPGAPRLGWDSFLATRPAVVDRTDPGYDLHAVA